MINRDHQAPGTPSPNCRLRLSPMAPHQENNRGQFPSSKDVDGYNSEEALQFWQSRTEKHLSPEDARQIRENLTGLFRLLSGWAQGRD